MRVMITGGTGFVGKALITTLQNRGDDIAVVGRDLSKIAQIYNKQVVGFRWQDLSKEVLERYDVIINLAGKNISDGRWSKRVKADILESRISTASKLATICSELNTASPRIYSASAVGIYGATNSYGNQPLPVDESWEIPTGFPVDFLSNIGQQWENAWSPAIKNGVSVTMMRFGVILKNNGGMLKKLIPLAKLGLSGRIGNGQQWLSWIHMDDLVSAIIFLIEHPNIIGPINLTHPTPVTQKEFSRALAQHYHRPYFFTLPEWLIKNVFGEMGEDLLLRGQKVIPTRLKSSGYEFNKKALNQAFV